MKTKQRKFAIVFLSLIMTVAVAFGVLSAYETTVKAENNITPTVTMIAGASARMTKGEPGIKFTAKISNYDSSYKYGMLILPESAWGKVSFNGQNYHEVLQGYTYADKICSVYTENNEKRISFSLKNLYESNYTRNFVGVAYTLKDGIYKYADIDLNNNARSIAYVAQMALKYEKSLTYDQKQALTIYANANGELEEDYFLGAYNVVGDGYFVNGTDNYVAKFYVDSIADGTGNEKENSFITKMAYAGGTTFSFKYYIPLNANVMGKYVDGVWEDLNAWWSVCWTVDPSDVNNYAHISGNGALLSTEKGVWHENSFTLPEGGPYYIYFAGSKGEWGSTYETYIDESGKEKERLISFGDGYVYIDDFTVGGTTENFNKEITEWTFDINTNGVVDSYLYKQGEISFGASIEVSDCMLIFDGNSIGEDEKIAIITDRGYNGVTEITFKAQWFSAETNLTWGLSYTTDPSNFAYDTYKNESGQDVERNEEEKIGYINCYTPRFGNLKIDAGLVYNYRLTISGTSWIMYANDCEIASGRYYDGENYFYFVISPDQGKDNAFFLDDFTVTYSDGTVVDTFVNGKSNLFVESVTKNETHGSIGMSFEESELNQVVEPEEPVLPTEKLGDYAMKFIFNKTDYLSLITKKAYAGGSTVSFKYFLPVDTSVRDGWWRLAYVSNKEDADNYGGFYENLGVELGRWTTVSFTLPEGDSYYLYFASSCSFEGASWILSNGEDAYVLIDNFTITYSKTVVETFDYGLENSIFEIKERGKVILSEDREGYTAGRFAAKIWIKKISSIETTPTFITKEAYTFTVPTTVTFDYYMSGNSKNHWWMFGWTNNKTCASIYAHTENNEENNYGKELPTNVQDAWARVSVEVPAGTWYFYIAGNRKDCQSTFSVIVDNIKFGNQYTETFNDGIDESIFEVNPKYEAAIELAEGKEDFISGNYSAKLDFTNSFDNNAKTFITKGAYASGGSVISFKYLIPEETIVGDKWAICFDTNGSEPDFWAVDNGIDKIGTMDEYGKIITTGGVSLDLNTNKGRWIEYTLTLPKDNNMYYVYFCAYSNWNGCIYIDDFQMISNAGIYYDDFSDGFNDNGGLFNVNANCVTVSSAYNYQVEVPETPNASAKINIDKFTGSSLAEFVTKNAYPVGSVVTFDYYIPNSVTFNNEETWWALCVTPDLLDSDVYNNRYLTLVKEQGEWKNISCVLDKAGYIYFAGAINEWNGGCVYIDNFTITYGNTTVTEKFNNGSGIFMVNNSKNAIEFEEVVIYANEFERPIEGDDYGFGNLLKNGKIKETLESGGYAYVEVDANVTVNPIDLPLSMAFIEGWFEYLITGNKQFAIYLGSAYIYVDGSYVALYEEEQAKGVVKYQSNGITLLYLAITAGGRVYVKINGGEYLGFGEIAQPTEFKIVALGGNGSVSFYNIAFSIYSINENSPAYFSTESINFKINSFNSEEKISEEEIKLVSGSERYFYEKPIMGYISKKYYNGFEIAHIFQFADKVTCCDLLWGSIFEFDKSYDIQSALVYRKGDVEPLNAESFNFNLVAEGSLIMNYKEKKEKIYV